MKKKEEKIGQYSIVEKIEESNYAIVYKVKDPHNNPLVLKIARKNTLNGIIIREFKILSQFRHPNIIRVFDYGKAEDGRSYFTLEYIAGQPINKYFRRYSNKFLQVILQIIEALVAIHERGFVHSDLKPEHILYIPEQEKSVLIDFGFSQLYVSEAKEVSAKMIRAGTIGYIAPEVLKGIGFDARADIYSLGVIIYEIIAGTKPKDTYKPIKGIPEELNNILAFLLSKEPTIRPSIIELHNTFSKYLPSVEFKKPSLTLTLPKTSLVKMSEIFNVLSSACGKTIILFGDAGSGKTRLFKELKFKFLMEGCDVLFYTPKQGTNFFKELGRFIGYEIFDFSKYGDKLQIYEELLTRVLTLSKDREIVIMVDNCEGLSDYELRLFRYIGYGIKKSNILLIGASKPDEKMQNLGFENLTMRPFVMRETRELLEKTFLKLKALASFSKWLQEHSGGNPFFIVEILNTLFEDKLLYYKSGVWFIKEKSLMNIKIPRKIETLFQKRFKNLSDNEKKILKIISLCDIPLYTQILDFIVETDIYKNIEHLKTYGLLREEIMDSKIAYTIDNMTFKEIIEESISKRERRLLHSKLLNVIENKYSGDKKFVPTLAKLTTALGQKDNAYHYFLNAAQNAEMMHDYVASIKYYENALSLIERPKESAEILVKIANINQKDGSFSKAIDCYSEASKCKRQDMNREIYCGLGKTYALIGDYKTGSKYLKKALNFFKNRETREYIKNINYLAYSLMYMNKLGEAESILNESLLLSKKINDLEMEAEHRHYQSLLELNRGDIDGGINKAKKNLEFTKKHKLWEEYAVTANLLGIFYGHRYELELAQKYFIESTTTYNKIKLINGLCVSLNNLARLYIQLGNYTKAEKLLEETLTRAQQTEIRHAQWSGFLNLAAINRYFGRFDEALNFYKKALTICPDSDYLGTAVSLFGMGITLYKKGKVDEAKSIFEKTMPKKEEILHFFGLALIEICLGKVEEGEALMCKGLEMVDSKIADSDIVSKIRPFLMAGQFFYERGDFERSLDFASKLKSLTYPLSREYNIASVFIKVNNYVLKKINEIDISKESTRLKEMGCIYDFAWIKKLRIESIINRGIEPIQIKPIAQEVSEIEDIFKSLGAGLELNRVKKIQEKLFPIVVKDYSRRIISIQYLETLSRLATLISQHLGDVDFIQNTLDLIVQSTAAERGALFIKSALGRMEFVAGRNIDRTTIKDAKEFSKSAIEALEKDEIIFSSDAITDPNFSSKKSVMFQQIHSLICLPLVVSENIIGAIYLDSRISSELFGPQDRDFLLTVSQILGSVIEKSIAFRNMGDEIILLKSNILKEIGTGYLIGKSRRMREIYKLIEDVATTDSPVLITGETGTGKGMIARLIHLKSKRKDKKFLSINCGTVAETLFESELFGHKRGSFTGAISDKKGLLEEVEAGTVFLDEIANTSIASQAKLLETIEEKVIRRVGETNKRKINVRFLFATNKDLEIEVESGRFRRDLFYRINVFRIEVPPLRERQTDIPLLTQFFLERYCKEINKHIEGFNTEALRHLKKHDWPGNVRELQNVIERTVISAKGKTITTNDLGFSELEPQSRTLQEMRRELVIDVLKTNNWNITKASKKLGITRPTLYKYMKQYNVIKP